MMFVSAFVKLFLLNIIGAFMMIILGAVGFYAIRENSIDMGCIMTWGRRSGFGSRGEVEDMGCIMTWGRNGGRGEVEVDLDVHFMFTWTASCRGDAEVVGGSRSNTAREMCSSPMGSRTTSREEGNSFASSTPPGMICFINGLFELVFLIDRAVKGPYSYFSLKAPNPIKYNTLQLLDLCGGAAELLVAFFAYKVGLVGLSYGSDIVT